MAEQRIGVNDLINQFYENQTIQANIIAELKNGFIKSNSYNEALVKKINELEVERDKLLDEQNLYSKKNLETGSKTVEKKKVKKMLKPQKIPYQSINGIEVPFSHPSFIMEDRDHE